jgi:hypothetical protein
VVKELNCPVCGAVFSTIEDLAAHLSTHGGGAATRSAPQGEVRLVEVGAEGIREVTATVVSAVRNCDCEFCKRASEKARFKPKYPRWHITLRPANENYSNFHTWITADKAYNRDPRTAGKGTQLGDYVQRLLQLGLRGSSVDDLFQNMIGKSFIFERAKIGKRRSETWIPKQLLGTGEGTKKIEKPVQACVEHLANSLEPGSSYTFEEVREIAKQYDEEVVKDALKRLEEDHKIQLITTKLGERYIYLG